MFPSLYYIIYRTKLERNGNRQTCSLPHLALYSYFIAMQINVENFGTLTWFQDYDSFVVVYPIETLITELDNYQNQVKRGSVNVHSDSKSGVFTLIFDNANSN